MFMTDADTDENDEILATYGAHSNDKLLAHYGFILPDNIDDSVPLDDVILANVTLDQRTALQSVGYLGNYSLTPDTGDICFRTQVAIRSIMLTSNEWEFFMGSGEDIAEDKTDAVRQRLVDMIRTGMSSMHDKVSQLEKIRKNGEGNEEVISMVLSRWKEILDALQRYIDPVV